MVLLDMRRSHYIGLNVTATYVWRLLETPQSLDDLCDALTTEFDIARERCRRSITELLDRMEAVGLVARTNA
jgi:hypothetical protein